MFQDGALLAIGPLDREQQEAYVLVVTASDGGSPRREVRPWTNATVVFPNKGFTVPFEMWRVTRTSCSPEHHHTQSETPGRQRQRARVQLQQLRQQRPAEGRRGGPAAAAAGGRRQRRQQQLARHLQVSPGTLGGLSFQANGSPLFLSSSFCAGGSSYVAVNAETGAVTLTSDLANVTEDTTLKLVAMAEDRGRPPLNATGSLLQCWAPQCCAAVLTRC